MVPLCHLKDMRWDVSWNVLASGLGQEMLSKFNQADPENDVIFAFWH
jgi:hypothetical protein